MTDAKTAAKVFMDNLVSNAQVGVGIVCNFQQD